ncbi:hypothetical protein EV683_107112 [Crenobacter luteus]|uniref:polysaccharide deacetylase family protein n=1 Tax=Crenobacter luteus TaxID=1452487 RepID=UPI00104447BE|nr:polysaccharide deacetylase family protein [Crenobacter luteus]TCP13087.1 hypothetical protein EV683_107112 [Crenobacter luteus]
MTRPSFLITIDTEGDNLWGHAPEVTTRNARYLERFQQLCEHHGFKPCYLTNYEMAVDPHFQAFGRDVIARGSGEIGMHLHAWNSPPLHALTADDDRHKPYLIEYPDRVMRDKVDFMTKLLEDTFAVKMVSHRAGRWAFDERYARLLVEYGYQVDCSVTPHVDWRRTMGNPAGQGGTDYRRFPTTAYFMDPDDIARPGDSPLLQVPMTIVPKHPDWVEAVRQGVNRLRGKHKPRSMKWLRPRGGNAAEMIAVARQALDAGHDYVEFMLHSSEFMPGGSPTFRDEASIERLYADLEALFAHLKQCCTGSTLKEYRDTFVAKHGASNA